MINSLHFENNHSFWPIVLGAILLWIIFIWKEWKQQKKSSFYLKVITGFIALSSLALIFLKPYIYTESKKNHLAILTNGFSQERLDSIKKEHKRLKTINYKRGEKILKEENIPSSIFVLGEGIADYDLWQVDSLNVKYIGNLSPTGITKVKYNKTPYVNDSLKVIGQYSKAKKGDKILLEDQVSNQLDSVVVEKDSTFKFSLSSRLKVEGKQIYNLVIKDSLNVVVSENIVPIQVASKASIKILIINVFPTFESKYLKNYLANAGHEVIIRSQVSRSNFKYEYFNTDSKPTISLTKNALEYFDLLIIDNQSLRSLASVYRNAIKESIKEQGLGVFVQNNNLQAGKKKYFSEFQFINAIGTTTTLKNSANKKIDRFPYSIAKSFNLLSIHESSNKIWTAYKQVGNGRISTSVLTNTFELQLSGNSQIYNNLWTDIINSVSKTKIPTTVWNSITNVVSPNEPFEFQIRTNIDIPKVSDEQGNPIAMLNDIDISTLWSGKTFPRTEGWQELKLMQDTTQSFYYYVHGKTHWESLRTAQTINTNKRLFQNKVSPQLIYKTKTPLNLTWFYLVFILSIGYLWLEPKL